MKKLKEKIIKEYEIKIESFIKQNKLFMIFFLGVFIFVILPLFFEIYE